MTQKEKLEEDKRLYKGDWVFIEEVKGYKNGPFQIKTADSFGYSFDEYHTIPFMYENLLSKWTIQEAKDGDILFHSDSASNGIFLFKEIRHDGKVLCYCDYDSEDHFCLGEHYTCCWVNAKILHPATKEQRDTLMKAMADAGYTFDFEKKELKKNERKHAEWSEEDDEMLDSIIEEVRYIGDFPDYPTKEENELYDECLAKVEWLKSFKERYTWKPSEGQLECLGYAIEKTEKDWSPLTNNRIYLTLKALKEQLGKL